MSRKVVPLLGKDFFHFFPKFFFLGVISALQGENEVEQE